jgi:hypothetical protein
MKNSMIRIYFISLLFLIALTSCNKNSIEKEEIKNWDKLQIITNFQKITIEKNSDSCNVENIIWNKKIYDIPPSHIVEDTINSKIYLTNAEKDSLKKWISSSILSPKFTDKNATDYVGNVIFKITDRNTTLSCEYNSVGNWSEVSGTTEKIYNLINKKTKLSTQ